LPICRRSAALGSLRSRLTFPRCLRRLRTAENVFGRFRPGFLGFRRRQADYVAWERPPSRRVPAPRVVLRPAGAVRRARRRRRTRTRRTRRAVSRPIVRRRRGASAPQRGGD
jgi:hypothetical protein